MAFSSSKRSWLACSGDQRRECKAHAVFNRLYNFPTALEGYMSRMKADLLQKIKEIENRSGEKLKDEEAKLLSVKKEIDKLRAEFISLEELEKIFPDIEKFAVFGDLSGMSGAHVKQFVKDKKLSKILRARKNFSWSGGSSSLPRGKVEASIGISDSLLDELMSILGAGDVLESWLTAGDAIWKKGIDGEIEKRVRERDSLKIKNPKDPKIQTLQWEIDRLESDWKL